MVNCGTEWRLIYLRIKNFKKVALILLLLFLISNLTACDLTQTEEKTEKVYLNLDVNNTYGVKKLEPGEGRFIYNKGAIAEIEFEYIDSYDFKGWEGKDREKITEKEDNRYIIQMNGDREIKANLELKKFKPLEVNFDNLDSFSYSEKSEITNVPHNLESVSIRFNNKLHSENELNVSINTENTTDEIDAEQIEIEDDHINIILSNWRDRFFSDDEEDNYLEFGEEYTLNVYSSNNTNIFDIRNREIDKNIAIDFKVEEPYPEGPDNTTVDIDNDNAKISWLRSKTNAQIDVEEYVENYIIYRSKNKDNLKDKESISRENVKEIKVYFNDPDINYTVEDKIIRYEDKEINLNKNEYYYRIKAINNYDNDSKLSNIVSTNE